MKQDLSSPENSSEQPLVHIVMINYNGWKDAVESLDSLLKSTYPRLKITVVDNASTDGSPERILERFPGIEVIVSPVNLGYPPGVNFGLTHAMQGNADYFLIINNDTYVDPEMITWMMKYTAPDVGMIGPLIYYAAEPEVIWSAGGKTNPLNLETRETYRNTPDKKEWPEVLEQDFITGCAVLFPRFALEKVGLMDPAFFWYYDDPDLSLRMRRAGYRILVVPRAKMWHKVARASGGPDSPKERYWMGRSSIIYFSKFARGVQIPVVIFWRTGSAVKTTLRLIYKRRWKSLVAYWRGIFHGFQIVFLKKNIPRLYAS